MNLNAFLTRIGYTADRTPNLANLNRLQRQFLLHIPFENLDIHQGIPLNFDSSPVFHKLVASKRGGVCYENNALFYDALTALGYEVKFLGAEMCSDRPLRQFYDHMSLKVTIDNQHYLVDVGNGRHFGAPVAFSGHQISRSEGFQYRIDEYDTAHLALYYRDESEPNSPWQPRFVFVKTPVSRRSFLDACHRTQTSPESHFTQSKVITQLTPTGRISLSQSEEATKFTVTTDGQKQEQSIDADQFNQYLRQYFQITLLNG
ncbi:arylamine N-acetyltransferase family protein [Ferrimonas aestuarii]|nr:arylamine N-acetyltransferase [Ferrimonas aestuarii]